MEKIKSFDQDHVVRTLAKALLEHDSIDELASRPGQTLRIEMWFLGDRTDLHTHVDFVEGTPECPCGVQSAIGRC